MHLLLHTQLRTTGILWVIITQRISLPSLNHRLVISTHVTQCIFIRILFNRTNFSIKNWKFGKIPLHDARSANTWYNVDTNLTRLAHSTWYTVDTNLTRLAHSTWYNVDTNLTRLAHSTWYNVDTNLTRLAHSTWHTVGTRLAHARLEHTPS